MHTQVIDFLEQVRQFQPGIFKAERVVEFGSYNINGSVRLMFKSCGQYTGVDWRAGPGVDEVSLAHAWSPAVGSASIGTVVSTEMLEHDPHWKASVAHMVELVQDSGAVLLTCAAPGRPAHELDCAPFSHEGWYNPIGLIELVQHLRELAEWDMLWAEHSNVPADTYVAAIGKKADGRRPMTSVVMPVVNNSDLTTDAVKSLQAKASQHVEIVLIDNGSTPDESCLLRALLPNVYLRYSNVLGYPAAVNRGIQVSAGQYVALCNNDTEMLTDGWDEQLIQALSSQADMVSPVFDYVGNMDQLVGNSHERHEARVLFFVMVLCNRRLFKQVGLLDERFGLGNSEDIDLSARIVRAGGRLWIEPAVEVHHVGHQTFEQLMNRDQFQALIHNNHELLTAKWQ